MGSEEEVRHMIKSYCVSRYINRGKEVALKNGQQFHLAAFLFRGKQVVRIGTNSFKTHPRFKRVYSDGQEVSHLHAEMDVLRFSKPGDIILVIRYGADGELSMAKPCEHCESFISDAKIKAVLYSNWDGNFEVMRV